MSRRLPRRRFWAEAGLALSALSLTVLTIAVPTWIELIFGVEPDAGEGWAELAITLAFVCALLGMTLLAVREWARPRAAAADTKA